MTSDVRATGAGLAAPDAARKVEAPTGTNGEGLGVRGSAADAAMVATERDRVTARDRLLADCRRRAATKGIAMHVLPGELLFCWCGLTKALPDAEAASRWLDHVGATR